ncbi:SRPBCC family protein [Streptomyces sp. NPDC006012]|uniref:SRPBCC family protein n=1 Tax=Streptomyces sp. NPDC006012 TaxID=3364739 RepID=UPI00369C0B1C
MGLYAETRVRAGLDTLWDRTQDPAQRRRWDLRITRITPLPGPADGPRRFRYATRVLPFLTLCGISVTAGQKERPDGTRASALRFAAAHPLSPITEGGGYLRYVPDGDGVRFLTGFDYRPRGGALGAGADRLLLRPLLAWATAWSFDRLRLWLERGITPERALRNWLAELLVRALVLTVGAACLALGSPGSPGGPFGALGPAVAYLCPLLLLVAMSLALFKAPLSGTPAARRCLRTPPARARAPRLLCSLENPS